MPRRLITAALAGALALGALTGCRFETANDAAFVGDTRYTQADVDRTIDAIKADGVDLGNIDLTGLRQEIIARSVFRDVAKRYAQEKGYPAPSVDYDSISQATGLPPSDPYVRVVAEAEAYRSLLLDKVKPVQPSDADFHDAYELLLSQQVVSAGTEAQIKPQLQQPQLSQAIGSGVALRNELTAAMTRYNASVNPKFLPIAYPLQQINVGTSQPVLVQLPLGGSQQAPVRDLLPTAAPTDDVPAQ
jgi:hypothetical protein